MKKKILIKGPFLSQSGYGYQARFALDSVRAFEDKFDIYLINTGWGSTSWIIEDDADRRWMDEIFSKTIDYIQAKGQFDLFLQVTIPNEIEKGAPVNILYTAGIETTKVSPEWIEKSNHLDRMIVVSNHSKEVFKNTVYRAQDKTTGQVIENFRCDVPIDVVNYPVKKVKKKKISLDLDHDFNFLAVAQWSPRKDIENTVKWFVEEFIDKEVGLVLKISTAKNCLGDRVATAQRLKVLLSKYENRKCSVHMLHGNMESGEMQALYTDPRIKAMISTTHGEGFGLPLFEAAYNGLPVVVQGWSGQCDFLYKDSEPLFAAVDFTVQPIAPEAVWDTVLLKDSMWSYADQGSFKMNLRSVYNEHEIYLKKAARLKKHIHKNFKPMDKYKEFVDALLQPFQVTEDEIESWLSSEIEVYD